MPCFAVAILRNVRVGTEIIAYLEGIDATLAPFGGRFVIHGGKKHMLEGAIDGDLVVIGFPDRASAEAWYNSPAYRALLPKRLGNADGVAFLIDAVSDDHKATDVLAVP